MLRNVPRRNLQRQSFRASFFDFMELTAAKMRRFPPGIEYKGGMRLVKEQTKLLSELKRLKEKRKTTRF